MFIGQKQSVQLFLASTFCLIRNPKWKYIEIVFFNATHKSEYFGANNFYWNTDA